MNRTNVTHERDDVKHASLSVCLEVFMEELLLEPLADCLVTSSVVFGY